VTRRNNSLERKALQLVLTEEGILQSEMWKGLGVSSREGSRLALKFEERGIIERRKALHNGRWTYSLYSKRKPLTLDSIKDCPCLICEEINRCFPGGSTSPINCRRLTEWIEAKAGEAAAKRS